MKLYFEIDKGQVIVAEGEQARCLFRHYVAGIMSQMSEVEQNKILALHECECQAVKTGGHCDLGDAIKEFHKRDRTCPKRRPRDGKRCILRAEHEPDKCLVV